MVGKNPSKILINYERGGITQNRHGQKQVLMLMFI